VIDIPGYRIVRALGRGGMATVYLAMQESVQREVALKIMSPTLHGDAEFGERFLREARIAASLRHRHVVQVHDVGRADDLHYIAMEYLSGGPVLQRDKGSGDLAFCLRITREIALALDYAHRRGVIHRDIKPDNILLRDDEAAVLSDFGIARAHDSKRMTMTGTILGTPHYMSPEQASGGAVDGRADLYSLGIVFHELVVGAVPFDAADWVSVGLMHLSAPVPRLPGSLKRLQPLVDTMLAKDPAERLQTGAELAEEIEKIERSLSGPRAVVLKPPSAPLTTVLPITNRREPPLDAVSEEPELGEIEAALARPSPRARRRTVAEQAGAPARAPAWRWLLLLLPLLLGIAYLQREPLRELLAPSGHEQILLQAEDALKRGHLSGDNPPGASQLFSMVIALNPDNPRARDGLARVAQAMLAKAREALAEDRVEDASAALDSARKAGAPGIDIDALLAEIRSREQQEGALDGLVRRAQAALAAGNLDKAQDSALELYGEALRVDPSSSVAQVGRRETLGLLLERARTQLAAGQIEEAAAQIDVVASIDPGHLALPEASARLAEARQRAESGLAKLIEEGDALLKQGRLIAPAGNSARDRYRRAVALDAANAAAAQGLRKVATALVQQASRKMADFEFQDAARLLDEAAATDAAAGGLRAAQVRLRELQQTRGDLAAGVLSPAQRETVDRTLVAAAAARAAGNVLYPPGESAWDLYRRVLSIEPANATARQGMAELPALARERFEAALGSSKLGAARASLEGLETLSPGDVALPDMKRRLAAALLGYATERLEAREISQASEALDYASGLDPSNPGLTALRARLDQARE
jgi:hypothetical protein